MNNNASVRCCLGKDDAESSDETDVRRCEQIVSGRLSDGLRLVAMQAFTLHSLFPPSHLASGVLPR